MQEKAGIYHEVYIREILSDLSEVGPNKPLGYLPIDTLVEVCGVDIEAYKHTLNQQGLKTLQLSMKESNVGWNGALFAYHEESLKQLLEERKSVLIDYHWPTDPEQFVRHLNVPAPSKTPIFDLIADAFNDRFNSGRTDVEAEKGITFVYFEDKDKHIAVTGFLEYNRT